MENGGWRREWERGGARCTCTDADDAIAPEKTHGYFIL